MMNWFSRKSEKHPQRFEASRINFIGEQDGSPERELKASLTKFFESDKSVRSAYLARVQYGEKQPISIALCVKTQFGPDPGLAEKVGRIFAAIFGGHEYMDLIFLTEVQETDLEKKCASFYRNGPTKPL